MKYQIKMGIPEMMRLWNDLQIKNRLGTIKKKEEQLYRKLGNTLKKLSEDPMYPALHSHEIKDLTQRYGIKVWQSYIENKKSSPMRVFWVYGPEQNEITVIGLEPHPEDRKHGAYERIKLSKMT